MSEVAKIKFIMAVLIFVFYWPSYGQISDRVQKINSALKEVGVTSNDTCQICDSSESATSEELYGAGIKSCVEQLCPDPGFSIPYIFDEAYNKVPDKNSLYEKELLPKIQALERAAAKQRIEEGAMLLAWLKTNPKLSEKSSIRLYNLFLALANKNKFYLEMQDGKLRINDAVMRSEFSEFTNVEYKAQVKVINYVHALELDSAIEIERPEVSKLQTSDAAMRLLLSKVASSIAEDKEIILASSKFKPLVNEIWFRQMLEHPAITDELIKTRNIDLLQKFKSAAVLTSVFRRATEDLSFQDELLTPAIDFKRKNLNTEIRTAIEFQMEQDNVILETGESDATKKCYAAYVVGQHILPTKSTRANMQKNISGYKRKYLDGVSRFLSTETMGLVRSEAADWHASLTDSRENQITAFISGLESITKAHALAKNNQQDMKTRYLDSVLPAVSSTQFLKMSFADGLNSMPSEVGDLCESLMPSMLPDAALPKNFGFAIGPSTMLFGEKANGIIYHEMGHFTSEILGRSFSSRESRKWYKKSLQCLAGNHSSVRGDMESLPTEFNNEDFSDLMSTVPSDDAKNIGCLMARAKDDRAYNGYSLTNSLHGDPHSSDLYRVLNIHVLKNGNIPKICEKTLASQGQKISFKNCLKDQ